VGFLSPASLFFVLGVCHDHHFGDTVTSSSRPNRRWWLWPPLLAVAAWLALYGNRTPDSKDSVSMPVRAAAAHGSQQAPSAGTPVELVPRDVLIAASSKESARDLFAAHSWNPPPPPAPPPQPEAAPSAPPVPYTYLGRKVEGDAWEVYLARGDQTFVAKSGTVLDGAWRVESAQPPSLVLTFLPLGQTQTLSIGDPQ
jgi:hypothetical protein